MRFHTEIMAGSTILKVSECVEIVVQRSGEVNQGINSNAGKTRGET